MTKISTLVCDWNGTLINDVHIGFRASNKVLIAFGLAPVTFDEYRDEIQTNYRLFYQKRGLPNAVTNEQLNAVRKEFLTKHWNTTRLHRGVTRLLKFCEAIRVQLAIVSGESQDILLSRLSQFNISKFFSLVHGNVLDKTASLKTALEQLGASPSESIYIDDSVDGLTSARQIGMYTIAFGKGYNPHQKLLQTNPTCLVNTHQQVISLLRHLT